MIKPIQKKQLMDVKYLRKQCPGQQIVLIWDGASYHKYKHNLAYLEEVNGGLPPPTWPVTCIVLAPNAPELAPSRRYLATREK